MVAGLQTLWNPDWKSKEERQGSTRKQESKSRKHRGRRPTRNNTHSFIVNCVNLIRAGACGLLAAPGFRCSPAPREASILSRGDKVTLYIYIFIYYMCPF